MKAMTYCGKIVRKHGEGSGDIFLAKATITSIFPCGDQFNYYDILVTSCKHTCHPFCLGEMLRIGNKCLVCKELLHLE